MTAEQELRYSPAWQALSAHHAHDQADVSICASSVRRRCRAAAERFSASRQSDVYPRLLEEPHH